jgi:SAM-dependent methyltransferase
MIAEWLVSAAGDEPWQDARHCLEVGAGAGHLLEQMARRHPQVSFEGLEPGEEAASLARRKGLAVRRGGIEAPSSRTEDVIYSVAVIEHVPSPTSFLRSVRERLRSGGWLLLCQPTQDVSSYDVLFVDHLHHFGTAHLAAYARKCGFEERHVVVGHPWMPNFSFHAWRATETPAPARVWEGSPASMTCGRTVKAVLADMAALDANLGRLAAAGRRVAAFGLNEVYALARAYSSLGEFPLVCGFDDSPTRPEYGGLPFPVVVPERGAELGVQDAILSMNRVYYPRALSRLESLGIVGHPVLSA